MKAAAKKLIDRGNFGKPNNGLLAVWAGANTQGAFDMGFSSEATEAILGQRPRVLFLADADPVGEDALSGALLKNGFNVVVEMFMTPSALQADVVLPRQATLERDGSTTSGERHVQRFYTAQQPVEGTLPDWRIFSSITRLLGGAKPKLSVAAVMQEIAQKVGNYAGISYPKLAETKPQFPDVGGADLYYGGTAYNNDGGLGIQWKTSSELGTAPTVAKAKAPAKPKLKKDELLIVPVAELYDRQPEFYASKLMHTHIDAPYITLNPKDAEALGLIAGATAAVSYGLVTLNAEVRVDHLLGQGVALIGKNLSDQPSPAVPVAGAVRKVEVMANA